MIIATATGNLGKDATLRDTNSGPVLGFGIASTRKDRGSEVTTWIDCSIWGKRGEALAQYLSKGTRVTVVGELGTREHNGKTYITMRVDHVDFSGSRQGSRERSDDSGGFESRGSEAGEIPDDLDNLPF